MYFFKNKIILFTSTLKVSSQSIKIGEASQYRTELIVEINVIEGTITSSSFFTFDNLKEI